MRTTADTQYPDRCVDLKTHRELLIVDDDDVCMLVHRRVARMSGLFNSIRSAPNGKAALEVLRQAEKADAPLPDIILLDLNMPVMTGLEFLDAFNRMELKNKAGISVVILSSSPAEKDKADAAALGAALYLVKPLSLRQINMVVSSVSMPRYTHYSGHAGSNGIAL